MDMLRDAIRLIPPFKTVGYGAYGQVIRCYAEPTSAVGDENKYVAVKVLPKFNDTEEEQTSASREVLLELDHLWVLKGKDGIAQLLSFTETTFDMQFVFPLYDEDIHVALTRGLFRKQQNHGDHLPRVCIQILRGLCHMHSL